VCEEEPGPVREVGCYKGPSHQRVLPEGRTCVGKKRARIAVARKLVCQCPRLRSGKLRYHQIDCGPCLIPAKREECVPRKSCDRLLIRFLPFLRNNDRTCRPVTR